jgi:hypothetical protein
MEAGDLAVMRRGNSRRHWVILVGLVLSITGAVRAQAADSPPAEAFRVLQAPGPEGPEITPYLKYQTEMAWRQDEERQREWRQIRTEKDLVAVQKKIEEQLMAMLGGLPTEHTPLHARVTGTIPMDGFHIEKLIYESVPGVYVTAHVYVPEDGKSKHPGILVPAGHSTNGKNHYQPICQRLVQRGYVVIAWDPVGQGERSQFWEAKAGKSRYNLICAEHAVMGNLAYLAGTNLARWEIWDGIRAIDYLVTRSDVDPDRINITGTSGGGFQAAHIAALDRRIKVAVPSCYITALPMRVYNRIFKDPDSDPEQDLYGMISNHVDNAGLLLMMYPRPVMAAAAVLDFFPIEGAQRSVREVSELYSQFGHADRIGMVEGYHGHEFSAHNQEPAMEFLDHFNGLPARHELAPVKNLDDKTLQVTRTGQVMLEFPDARSLMDEIREYYLQHKSQPGKTILQMYSADSYPGIHSWTVAEFQGAIPGTNEIRWEARGTSEFEGITIDRYLLHHSRYLQLPLLYFHKTGATRGKIAFWLGENGKATEKDWVGVSKLMGDGYEVVSIDPRGLGETRMMYKAASPDDPSLANLDFDHAYVNPLSGVLSDYVYNGVLTGRPYLLQMIEDVEIAGRFAKEKLNAKAELSVIGSGRAGTLASAVAEALPDVHRVPQSGEVLRWSEIVEQKMELWPIEYLLPGGAYVH